MAGGDVRRCLAPYRRYIELNNLFDTDGQHVGGEGELQALGWKHVPTLTGEMCN
jgi:hypothetical protein